MSLDVWLATLPRGVLVVVCIFLGIFLIFLFSPPHSVCESQKEIFMNSQKSFVFLDPAQKGVKKTGASRLIQVCKKTNSPGGCYELFSQLRNLLREFKQAGQECSSILSQIPQVKSLIWSSLNLITALDWSHKVSWLDITDKILFCDLKKLAKNSYGVPTWQAFQKKTLKSHPQIDSLSPKEAWKKSLLSTRCL